MIILLATKKKQVTVYLPICATAKMRTEISTTRGNSGHVAPEAL